jgi:hypothetical protein
MVKYVNEYHGSYLRRGVDYTLDGSGNQISSTIYRQKYVEWDQVVHLNTSGRWTTTTDFTGFKTGSGYELKLTIDQPSRNIVIESLEEAVLSLTENGNGKFVPEGDSWGGEKKDAIYLNYKYFNGTSDHMVYDTIVFRDRGIKYEEFSPSVLQ